jgi:hypothetical protein
VNEADSRSVDTPDWAIVTPGSSGEPSFNPSWEVALDGIAVVLMSFDIANPGDGELGLLGYP